MPEQHRKVHESTGLAAEIKAFEAVYAAVQEAQDQIGALSADIYRHLFSLGAGDNVRRTSEMQATLSLEETEKISHDLVEARDALRAVLEESGASE